MTDDTKQSKWFDGGLSYAEVMRGEAVDEELQSLPVGILDSLIAAGLLNEQNIVDAGAERIYLDFGHDAYIKIRTTLLLNDWPAPGSLKTARDWDNSLSFGFRVGPKSISQYWFPNQVAQLFQKRGIPDMDAFIAMNRQEAAPILHDVINDIMTLYPSLEERGKTLYSYFVQTSLNYVRAEQETKTYRQKFAQLQAAE